MHLEKIECPQMPDVDDDTEAPARDDAKVISLADLKKK